MKLRRVIKIFVLILIVILAINVNIAKAEYNYPNLEKVGSNYIINYDVYKNSNNLWCIEEGSHLTSYHSCLYEEYGSEQTIDVSTETDENKIALALAALDYSDFTGDKYHNISERTMQYLANKVGFGGAYYGTGNSDKFIDNAKIINKLNELRGSSPINLEANETSEGVYEASFDEFSGLNSSDFNLQGQIVEGDGTLTVDPEGIINSSGKSAKIKISNPSETTTQVKVKFSCKIKGPKKLKYKTIRLATCSESSSHSNVAPEKGEVIARWSEVKGKLQAAGCTMREAAGYELWNCGCPGKDSMFVGEGSLNTLKKYIHNCTYHHYLNHINDWSVNEQNLAMYYIEEGDLEFEFEIIIKLKKSPPTIKVKKNWEGKDGKVDNNLPNVEIALYEDGTEVDSITISPSDISEHEFTYELKSDKTYTVKEETSSPTTVTVSGTDGDYTITYDNNSYPAKKGETITITNKIKPPPTPTPSPTPSPTSTPTSPPTPSPSPSASPSPGQETYTIKKTVEYVLSKYEGDTSQHGIGASRCKRCGRRR